jgi:hypothetical protein
MAKATMTVRDDGAGLIARSTETKKSAILLIAARATIRRPGPLARISVWC